MVGSMLQAPTGKIHQAKTSQGIQKEGYHKGGMFFLFGLLFLPSFYFKKFGLVAYSLKSYVDLRSLSFII